MLLTTHHHLIDTYAVEASGWDSDQIFFVEKAELAWNEVTGKHLTLTRSICPGSMIFLRLLQPLSSDRSLPVAYHAQPIGVTPDGRQKFRLNQIQPSGSSKDNSE